MQYVQKNTRSKPTCGQHPPDAHEEVPRTSAGFYSAGFWLSAGSHSPSVAASRGRIRDIIWLSQFVEFGLWPASPPPAQRIKRDQHHIPSRIHGLEEDTGTSFLLHIQCKQNKMMN